ncbi:hypothetical protein GALMADRAFT_234914 [Galerina marginata CBS 339.88]|uniref:Arrestin-like N-terminal domain-containing protein n=1 Tax=Galerina marginata (strain CBS 339.88) TaxID=685588 RepID=A0A067U339_GALM3|nr:hypothetical protein GALMADRAFT_234914 [Galerina marginata CBS 339.88]
MDNLSLILKTNPHSYLHNPTMQTAPPPAGVGVAREHHSFLETAKGRKWLSMSVKSRATSAASLPIFFEGDTISGRVMVDLDQEEHIKGVSISIQAGTTLVGQEEDLFLKEEQRLWTGSKLNGKHSWPFTFELPKTVSLKENTKSRTFPLPPHFTERASPAYIDYKLVVTVKRGFLKVNQTLVTGFGYQPITLPDLPSPLRQMAYAERSPLVGPAGDPAGWKILPMIKIKGILFNTKQVEVDCTLAVATPLSYAVDSPIPLIITLSGEDPHALDVLAHPSAVQLRLRRSMATGREATDDDGARRADNHFVEDFGSAYFWPSRQGAVGLNTRVMEGELELLKSLKPSFKFPNVTVRYSLDLLGFTATGFVANEDNDAVLLKEQVTIVTRQIIGLVSYSYAPPGYEKPQGGDYNMSMGLLANGNQRFWGPYS